MWRETRHHYEDAILETDLKICDLCGSLNLNGNSECFVCGWHGRFETRSDIIRIAMDLLKRKHGELRVDLLTDGPVFHHGHATTVRGRIGQWLGRARHWLFG